VLHNRLPQEKYLKLKNLVTHFRSIFISEYSGQISQKIVDLHTLLIHLKRRDSLKKWVQVFALWRFINKSRLPRGICQLKKLPANEITESLAFTVCKLELCGKWYCYSHVLGAHVLGQWSTMGKTEGKQCLTKQKETEEQLPKRDYKEAILTDMKSLIYM